MREHSEIIREIRDELKLINVPDSKNNIEDIKNKIEEYTKVFMVDRIRKPDFLMQSEDAFLEYIRESSKPVFMHIDSREPEYTISLTIHDYLDKLEDCGGCISYTLQEIIEKNINNKFKDALNNITDYIITDMHGVGIESLFYNQFIYSIERVIKEVLIDRIRKIKNEQENLEIDMYYTAMDTGIESIYKHLINSTKFKKCTNEKLRKAYSQQMELFDNINSDNHNKDIYSVYFMLNKHRKKGNTGEGEVYQRYMTFLSKYNSIFEIAWNDIKENRNKT